LKLGESNSRRETISLLNIQTIIHSNIWKGIGDSDIWKVGHLDIQTFGQLDNSVQIFWDVHFLGCAAERAEMCVLCTDSHRVGNHSSPTMQKQLFCSLQVVPSSSWKTCL